LLNGNQPKKQTIREIHLMYITPLHRPFANAPGEEVMCSRSATCSRFARRLLAVANPAALTSAEAVQDPLAALAFLCPEETSLVEVAWMEMEGRDAIYVDFYFPLLESEARGA